MADERLTWTTEAVDYRAGKHLDHDLLDLPFIMVDMVNSDCREHDEPPCATVDPEDESILLSLADGTIMRGRPYAGIKWEPVT